MKWSVYNQSLVKRGEIILGFDVINNWDAESKKMNKDKVGLGTISLSKYIPSSSSIFFFCLDMLKEKEIPFILDYTTINRRINRLDIKIKDTDGKVKDQNECTVIAIDSTGYQGYQ